jgi:hypothetical protein
LFWSLKKKNANEETDETPVSFSNMNSPFLPEKAQKKNRKRPRRRGTMQSYFVHRFVVQSKLKNIGVFSMIAV